MYLLFSNTYLSEYLEVRCSLLLVDGIGYSSANHVCDLLGLPIGVKLNGVSIFLFVFLCMLISENYLVEIDLNSVNWKNIRRVLTSNSYSGISHSSNLPVSGQRTHTNARTRKNFFVV